VDFGACGFLHVGVGTLGGDLCLVDGIEEHALI
jgi:hypothetical protein